MELRDCKREREREREKVIGKKRLRDDDEDNIISSISYCFNHTHNPLTHISLSRTHNMHSDRRHVRIFTWMAPVNSYL